MELSFINVLVMGLMGTTAYLLKGVAERQLQQERELHAHAILIENIRTRVGALEEEQ